PSIFFEDTDLATHKGADILDYAGLSQSSVFLRSIVMRGRYPAKQRKVRIRGAVYNDRRSQRCGLGRTAPDMWFWLVIGQ
uniref:Transposase n=1 Tax=Mesocestoides corti TaxID=53468 RepID=A0A5K3F9X8_MESCO